eukprot:2233607-Amphidinium_carterae.1
MALPATPGANQWKQPDPQSDWVSLGWLLVTLRCGSLHGQEPLAHIGKVTHTESCRRLKLHAT